MLGWMRAVFRRPGPGGRTKHQVNPYGFRMIEQLGHANENLLGGSLRYIPVHTSSYMSKSVYLDVLTLGLGLHGHKPMHCKQHGMNVKVQLVIMDMMNMFE